MLQDSRGVGCCRKVRGDPGCQWWWQKEKPQRAQRQNCTWVLAPCITLALSVGEHFCFNTLRGKKASVPGEERHQTGQRLLLPAGCSPPPTPNPGACFRPLPSCFRPLPPPPYWCWFAALGSCASASCLNLDLPSVLCLHSEGNLGTITR